MKELVKYLLGIVIVLTIIYTIYISYNVLKFVSSEESKTSINDYEIKISLIDEDIRELENRFNENQLRNNPNNIVMNYDGTPIVWVLRIELGEDLSQDKIENSLMENVFIFFQKDDAFYIGPYMDKMQLEEAKKFILDSFSIKTNEIQQWKI